MIDSRLQAIINFIPQNSRIADIGADHGYLAIELARKNISDFIIATDKNIAPAIAAKKNIVAAGLARRCEIQLAYAIGVAHPVSILVDTFGTGVIADDKIAELVKKNFSLSPTGIIRSMDLRRPIYKQTAAYGHMGRTDIDVPWERTDKAATLKEQAGL